jgi:hypothetical protein
MHKPITTALVKFFIESPFLKIEVQDFLVVSWLQLLYTHPVLFQYPSYFSTLFSNKDSFKSLLRAVSTASS